MTVSIGLAVLVVMATVVLALVSTVSPVVKLSADSTALIMGGTSVPTPDDAYIEIVKNRYIAPTHPGQDINYVAVTTPEEFWPVTWVRPPWRARVRGSEHMGTRWLRVPRSVEAAKFCWAGDPLDADELAAVGAVEGDGLGWAAVSFTDISAEMPAFAVFRAASGGSNAATPGVLGVLSGAGELTRARAFLTPWPIASTRSAATFAGSRCGINRARVGSHGGMLRS